MTHRIWKGLLEAGKDLWSSLIQCSASSMVSCEVRPGYSGLYSSGSWKCQGCRPYNLSGLPAVRRLWLGLSKDTLFPGWTGTSHHRTSPPAQLPDCLGYPLLGLPQLINIFLVPGVSKLDTIFCGLTEGRMLNSSLDVIALLLSEQSTVLVAAFAARAFCWLMSHVLSTKNPDPVWPDGP